MGRRPVCLVCLLLMGVMCLLDLAGFPLVRGNPLPAAVRQEILLHPEATVVGEAVRYTNSEVSHSVYLKQVCLIKGTKKIPIQNLRVFLKEDLTVPVGTLLVLSGKLEEIGAARNPGEFDSRQYYACQHIYYFLKQAEVNEISQFHSKPGQLLVELREYLAEIFETGTGGDAPLFETMLLGDKSNLETETKLKYQAAGILHILAISGLHISMIGMGLYRLFQLTGMGMYLSGFLALLVIVPYGAMTGESVSAMRAICMFLLAVGARILGEAYDRLTALALAAILLLLESPAYLYSSSFLMSFTAVVGISVVSPKLCELLSIKKTAWETLAASLAVQLTMLPVLLIFYGEVSLAGIFLNLLVLPTVGVILTSGIGGGLLGICYQMGYLFMNGIRTSGVGSAAEWAFFPGRFLLHVYELLCDWILQLPFGTWVPGCPVWWQIAGYYGVLAGSLAVGVRLKRAGYKKLLLILLLGNCLLFVKPVSTKLVITCLDVGQGDGIVVETPGEHCFLIDGGSTSRSGLGSYVLLPYLKHQGITMIDAVFLSHTDQDHINGIMELLELMEKRLVRLKIKTLILPEWNIHTEPYQKLLELAETNGIRVFFVKQGDSMKAGALSIQVLAPLVGASGEDPNADAQVLKLDFGSFCGLFTGDIGEETEKMLLPELPDVSFLKVAHHGSRYSTCREFLDQTKPELAVISCSASNRYGHPSPETVERLEHAGARVEYTMEHGAITVMTDGENVWLDRFLP